MDKYNLVVRFCKCNCGLSWRCLITSHSQYYSISHMKKYGRYGYIVRSIDGDEFKYHDRAVF